MSLPANQKSTWRKNVNREIGFVAGKDGKAAKERYASLIERLDAHPEFLAMLSELSALPPQEYSEEESQMLQHMLVILRYAVAELRLVFAERGVVDFVELGLAARQVLRDDEGELSELAADRGRAMASPAGGRVSGYVAQPVRALHPDCGRVGVRGSRHLLPGG